LDHTLANLQMLVYLRHRGARAYLYDNDFMWTVLENESFTVDRTVEWGLLSLFCMGEKTEGIDLTGVQYPLTNGSLTGEFSLGVSNHIMAPQAEISVKSGVLAVGWELQPLSEQ